MAPCKTVLKDELKNITTLNLIASTSNVLEKILWALIAICGTLFIYEVVYIQLENWRNNPSLVTKEMKKLSDLPLPAVTFCHKGLYKYGPVEYYGNLIDSEKVVPTPVFNVRNEYLKVQFQKIKKNLEGKPDYCEWLFNLKSKAELDHPMIYEVMLKDQENEKAALKKSCLVSVYIENL